MARAFTSWAISLAKLLLIQLYFKDEKYMILHDVIHIWKTSFNQIGEVDSLFYVYKIEKNQFFSLLTNYLNIYYVEFQFFFSNWAMPTAAIL